MLRFLGVFFGSVLILTSLCFGLGILRWEQFVPADRAADEPARSAPSKRAPAPRQQVREPQPQPRPQQANADISFVESLPSHLDHADGYGDYQLQPRNDADYIYIGARSATAQVVGDDLDVTLTKVTLSKIDARARAEFSALGVVVLPLDPEFAEAERFAWQGGMQGVLTRDTPVVELDQRKVSIVGGAMLCRRGCMLRVTVAIGSDPRDGVVDESSLSYIVVGAASEALAPIPEPDYDWRYYAERATRALSHKDRRAAERNYLRGLVRARQAHDETHPAVGLMLAKYARLRKKDKDMVAYSQALAAAYRVYEHNSPVAMRNVLHQHGFKLDMEQVARELGDFYWDERNYAVSYGWYRRAYDAIPDLALSPSVENRRYAFDAAGVMKTACVQKKFEETVRAMQELKQRINAVSERDKEYLDYWIRTGDPRIKDGRCGG